VSKDFEVTAVVRDWDSKKVEIRDEDDTLKMLSDCFHIVRKDVSLSTRDLAIGRHQEEEFRFNGGLINYRHTKRHVEVFHYM
jgi:hypothetical protein